MLSNEADAIIILYITRVLLVKVQEETRTNLQTCFFLPSFVSLYMQFMFRAAGIPDSI